VSCVLFPSGRRRSSGQVFVSNRQSEGRRGVSARARMPPKKPSGSTSRASSLNLESGNFEARETRGGGGERNSSASNQCRTDESFFWTCAEGLSGRGVHLALPGGVNRPMLGGRFLGERGDVADPQFPPCSWLGGKKRSGRTGPPKPGLILADLRFCDSCGCGPAGLGLLDQCAHAEAFGKGGLRYASPGSAGLPVPIAAKDGESQIAGSTFHLGATASVRNFGAIG